MRQHILPLLALAPDAKFHYITGLQKLRRFHAHANPRQGVGKVRLLRSTLLHGA